MLTHVVLFRLHDPADAEEVVRRLHALRGRIPALLSLEAGVDVLGSEQSYDVALVTTHEDMAGMQAYQVDPVHAEFAAWLRPLVAARAAVDHEG